MNYRTPLANVRGLGSAREGTRHFWAQRVTAIALVPLGLWFMTVLLQLVGADYATATATLQSPLSTVLGLGLVLALFYHAYLGMQVVIEDYVHGHWMKLANLLILKFACLLMAAAAAVALLTIALGS